MKNQVEQNICKITMDEVNSLLEQWIGQKAQNARIGVGTFLLIDFGQLTTEMLPPTRLRPQEKIIQKGEWFLWIYQCMWRVIYKERIIVSSLAETKEEMQCVVEKINHSKLEAVEITQPFFDAKFTFSNGYIIETFSIEDNDDYWMLKVPDGSYLTFRANSEIKYES